jgi:predicted Zn-dependent peptidase
MNTACSPVCVSIVDAGSRSFPFGAHAISKETKMPAEQGVRKEVFSNGLTVITEAMPAVRSVSIGIWLKAGSREETESENGITHFLEHMVFKGTKHRTAEQIARSADSIGGHLDAFTAKEFTNFSTKVLDEHVPRAFEVLADLVKNPLLRPDHIAKESGVIREEIKMVEDTPDDLVHELFSQTYWRGHALGRPILGTRETVSSFDRKRLLQYFRRYYVPNNMLITAAGHLEHGQVAELALKEFGEAACGQQLKEGPAPVAHPRISQRRKKNLEQVHIVLGTPGYPQTHERRFAAYILNTVLGGGMSSRLFQNVREKRGLAYAVFSSLSTYRDTGCLSVYAGTAPASARNVVDLVTEELRRLKSTPPAEEELQRAKDYLKGSMLLALESTMSRMSNLARQEIYFRRQFTQDEIAQQVDAVTDQDVLAAAGELFQTGQVALTVLGPLNGINIDREELEC